MERFEIREIYKLMLKIGKQVRLKEGMSKSKEVFNDISFFKFELPNCIRTPKRQETVG